MWITKQEYDENGPSIVHRKCFTSVEEASEAEVAIGNTLQEELLATVQRVDAKDEKVLEAELGSNTDSKNKFFQIVFMLTYVSLLILVGGCGYFLGYRSCLRNK